MLERAGSWFIAVKPCAETAPRQPNAQVILWMNRLARAMIPFDPPPHAESLHLLPAHRTDA